MGPGERARRGIEKMPRQVECPSPAATKVGTQARASGNRLHLILRAELRTGQILAEAHAEDCLMVLAYLESRRADRRAA
jgi:hypothetical protein